MKFMTATECREWLISQGVSVGAEGMPERYPPLKPVLRFELPTAPHQLAWLCRFITDSLMDRREGLLWIKEFGTFPSTENLHLYYRVRQSYADLRLLREAPGHLFLAHEAVDVQTFLLMGIVNGWEMHLFPGESETSRAIFAHDNEWIALYHPDASTVAQWQIQIEKAEYTILIDRAT
jgi:hypothetical protein